MFSDFLYKFVEMFSILRRIQRDMIRNLHSYSCEVRIIVVVVKF